MTTWNRTEVEALRAVSPALTEILEACPFDGQFSIRGLLTQDLFFRAVMTGEEELQSLAAELLELLESRERNFQFVFLHGYPGTGKSTFIHAFRERYCTDHTVAYMDFSKALDEDDREGLFAALRSELRQLSTDDAEPIKRALSIITSNPKRFLPILSASLRSLTPELVAELKPSEAIDLLNECKDRDLLHLFVISHRILYRAEGKTVVVIDNLDDIRLSHLAKSLRQDILQFQKEASDFYINFQVEDSVFNFNQDFRFILCLREANYQVTNAHLIAHGGQNWKNLPFRINVGWRALRARLHLAAAVFDTDPNQLRQIMSLQRILDHTSGDEGAKNIGVNRRDKAEEAVIAEHVIAPLFNFDSRKLARAIYDAGLAFSREWPRMNAAGIPIESTIHRGTVGRRLIHEACQGLKEKDFAGSVFDETLPPAEAIPGPLPAEGIKSADQRGHCLLLRMLLTVTRNLSRFSRKHLRDKGTRTCQLSAVVNELLPYYKLDEILQTVADGFLFHTQDWVSVIIISEKRIESSDAFEPELTRAANEWASNTQLNRNKLPPETKRILGGYGIEITAAGYTFVKHILPSFEFYSVSSGQPSLYEIGLNRTTRNTIDLTIDRREEWLPTEGLAPRGSGFAFQGVVGRVYGLVKSHVMMMGSFYDSVIQTDPMSFKRSALAFHDGERYPTSLVSNDEQPQPASWSRVGVFHSFRLISGCTRYLDEFRRHLFSDSRYSEEDAREANDCLLNLIRQFAHLYANCQDPASAKYRESQLEKIESNRRDLIRFVEPIATVELQMEFARETSALPFEN